MTSLRESRQMFADLNSWRGGVDWSELTANIGRRLGFMSKLSC